MPLRLLGLVPDLESLPELGGLALAGYAARGVAVTIACAGGPETATLRSRARLLGIQALVLLDYRPAERESPALTELFTDLIRAIRPHVVVVCADDEAIRTAGTRAFDQARRATSGSGSLPAKLYHRFRAGGSPATVSTALRIGSGTAAVEGFQRIFPSPWVTGVLERDLFAGLTVPDEAPAGVDEQLAS
ncbi:MAG: hypothetical protein M3077_01140 [Candidatus Dormibacteraeota bacterium]|nr:hypothetical protein [Candidatus Dormibacteraeota bacterium]